MEIRIVIDDRIVRFLRGRRVLACLVAFAALGAVSSDAGQTFSVPNTFNSGDLISSSAMNKNFSAIAVRLNGHEGRISALEGQPLSPSVQFIKSGGPVAIPVGAKHVLVQAIGQGGGGGASGTYAGKQGGAGQLATGYFDLDEKSTITIEIGTAPNYGTSANSGGPGAPTQVVIQTAGGFVKSLLAAGGAGGPFSGATGPSTAAPSPQSASLVGPDGTVYGEGGVGQDNNGSAQSGNPGAAVLTFYF